MSQTLLYIDPDPATRRLVDKVLSAEGITVQQAAGALDGQEAATQLRPEFILVDVDGVRAGELVAALRRSPGLEHARLLASTAHAWPEHAEKLLAAGFDRVLLQPLDIDTLARELTGGLPLPGRQERAAAPPAPAPGAPAGEIKVAGRVDPEEIAPALAHAGPALDEPASVAWPAAVALAPVEVARLWRLSLAHPTVALMRSTASAAAVLALLDAETEAFVVTATAAGRQADGGHPLDLAPPVGTRVAAAAAPWALAAVRAIETASLPAEGLDPSPLIPAGSHRLLVVPIASGGVAHGVAILAKHRRSKPPAFAPARLASTLAQTRQIAGIVEMLKDLDRAAGRKRRELQQLRIETVKGLLGDLVVRTRPSRRGGGRRQPDGADGDCVIRLGLALAERLGLPPRRRDVLRQALEVRDVGREWVERVLFGRGPFSVAGRERALERHAEHGAEILTALDWPPAVVELVRRQQARGGGDGQPTALCTADLPVEARIMAVMSAFGDLTAGRPADAGAAGIQEALAEIARHAGTRYDPEVVQALIGLGPSRHPGSRQP